MYNCFVVLSELTMCLEALLKNHAMSGGIAPYILGWR